MSEAEQSLDISTLRAAYREGKITPQGTVDLVLQRIEDTQDNAIWIHRLSSEQLQPYIDRLDAASLDEFPLYGIPFAIKDNIDLAAIPTTAACPDYAYTPESTAFAVQCLIDAGAIPIGKTNLDQFATGLVGTRSPYGVCANSIDSQYIAGGSSSGSAVAVACGLVSFALGTDTAGSGRVPAAFNNIVGIKPTRGMVSTRGVVPACRSLDCVSVFALTVDDARHVLQVAAQYDGGDAFARELPTGITSFSPLHFKFGVPQQDQLVFFNNRDTEALFEQAITRLTALGGEQVTLDIEPFLSAARLLYEGPWVGERYAAIESFIEQQPHALLDVTREIIKAGNEPRAVDVFKAQYRLMDLRRQSEQVWNQVDMMLMPTASTIYRIEEINADPLGLNSKLGYYTNFMNLLDLASVAVPAGFMPNGLPFGVTIMGPAWTDASLAAIADRLHRDVGLTAGATGLPLPSASAGTSLPKGVVPLMVCGAHMSGLPLNHQLTDRGAWLMKATHTAAHYRLYALPGGPPWRPGLVRDTNSAAIDVEVWAIAEDRLGSLLQHIPAPLGLGKVELDDGSWVTGFICEPCAMDSAVEVTAFGGWRAYLDSKD